MNENNIPNENDAQIAPRPPVETIIIRNDDPPPPPIHTVESEADQPVSYTHLTLPTNREV